MKVVLVRFKDSGSREFPLTDETTVVGRRPDSGLCIASSEVSRRHCEIAIRDDVVLVKDLGSSNGTYVNGKRIAETELSAGDRLGIGPVVFVVQIDGRPEKIKPSDAQLEGPPAAPAPAQEDEKEEVFELGEDDFDIDDALTALDESDEDQDLP